MQRILSLTEMVAEPEDARDLTCAICLSLLSQPLQCKRGHVFCTACIERHITTTADACPECRIPLRNNLSRALFVEKAVRSVKVRCRHHFVLAPTEGGHTWTEDREQGCPEVIALENAPQHERDCGYRFVECPFLGCSCKRIRARDLAAHTSCCEHRLMTCEYCHSSVVAKWLQRHVETECDMFPVTCQACHATNLPRKNLHCHSCPEELVPCVLAGCADRVARKNMEAHLQDTTSHMVALAVQMEATTKRFARMLAIRDDNIAMLEEMVRRSRERGQKLTLIWNINWAKADKFCRSKTFNVEGFEFFFGLWPHRAGGRPRKGTSTDPHISVFLFLEKRERDYASITCEFSFSVLNHTYPQLTINHNFESITFPVHNGQGWGEDNVLLSNSVSKDTGYLDAEGQLCVQGVFRVLAVQYEL